jgi:hypothetical protein
MNAAEDKFERNKSLFLLGVLRLPLSLQIFPVWRPDTYKYPSPLQPFGLKSCTFSDLAVGLVKVLSLRGVYPFVI